VVLANAPQQSLVAEQADDEWLDINDPIDNEIELSAEGGEQDVLLEYA